MTRLRNRPTLKDIARLANCSPAVVSTVVNKARGNTLVSDQMRQRVEAAARELGYRPNFASRSLIRQSTETIGVYVPPGPSAGLGFRYESAIVRGIERACRERGYDLLAINLGGEGGHERCVDKFAEGRIEGLVLLHVAQDATWLGGLLKESPNVVAVNYYGDAADLTRINFDDRAAAALATEHLASLGHRRIAYFGCKHWGEGHGALLRRDGYLDAMRRAGLAIDPRWVWERDDPAPSPPDEPKEAANAADAMALWFGMGEARPTAVVCYSDLLAARLYRQLYDAGLTVPDHLSIVGINDSNLCQAMIPGLTSVCQPLDQMGFAAAAAVIEAERSGDKPRFSEAGDALVMAAPSLVVRESTAAPSA